MLEIKDNVHYINVFENITELSKYLTSRETKKGRDECSLDEDEHSLEFTKTKNFKEALDLMKYGDEKLYNQIKKESKKININKIVGALNQRIKYKNRFYGSIPNVPMYLKGNPVNMINAEKKQPKNKILNIFLNIRVNGITDSEDIMRIGLKYLTVVDILEQSGYRCNLYSGCANEGYNDDYSYLMVRVKTDKEPLNLKKICFTIANPSMQRRIKFRWMEVNDCEHDYTRHGYGYPDDTSHTKQVLNDKLKDNFIVFTYESDNRKKSEKEIIEDLKKEYGINVGDE